MDNQEKEFIKGFNVGYLLSKHDPELLLQLTNSKNNSSNYFKAMALGAKQNDRERLLEQMKKSQQQTKKKVR